MSRIPGFQFVLQTPFQNCQALGDIPVLAGQARYRDGLREYDQRNEAQPDHEEQRWCIADVQQVSDKIKRASKDGQPHNGDGAGQPDEGILFTQPSLADELQNGNQHAQCADDGKSLKLR